MIELQTRHQKKANDILKRLGDSRTMLQLIIRADPETKGLSDVGECVGRHTLTASCRPK